MSRQKYTHVQALLPEIRAMVAAGKTQREIAQHFGLRDKYVIKRRKTPSPRDVIAEQSCEIDRLKRENNLPWDFLQLTERM